MLTSKQAQQAEVSRAAFHPQDREVGYTFHLPKNASSVLWEVRVHGECARHVAGEPQSWLQLPPQPLQHEHACGIVLIGFIALRPCVLLQAPFTSP